MLLLGLGKARFVLTTESLAIDGLKLLFVSSMTSMMTSSNGNIFRVTGPLCGEFTDHR